MSDLKPCPTCDKPRCCHCDFTPFAPGADWGHLEGPKWSDYCQHVSAMRYCDSCSQHWWQVGLEDDWDIDGCAKQDCPECVAANAAEKEEPMDTNNTPRLAPLVPAPPTETVSAIAACIVSAYERFRAGPVDPDEVTAVTVVARMAGGAR